MKKPSSRIKEEIAKLQEQLKAAEAREAERIGRVALKAGLGELEIEDGDMLAAFEAMLVQFRRGAGSRGKGQTAPDPSGAVAGQTGEA